MCLPQLSDTFNGADLRNVVTEAGMFAIRDDRSASIILAVTIALTSAETREYINQEDLTKAARKVGEAKKHESQFSILIHVHLALVTDALPQLRWSIRHNIPIMVIQLDTLCIDCSARLFP